VVPVILARRHWTCPNCPAEEWTTDPRPHTRFHTCPGLRGLTAPMVLAGTKAKVEAHEREDYVNGEAVQLDPERGRPVQSVITTRDDGQDTTVYAPTATGKGS
jgi:hypothetical protein